MRVLRRSLEMEGTGIEIIVSHVRRGVNAPRAGAFQDGTCPEGQTRLPERETPRYIDSRR